MSERPTDRRTLKTRKALGEALAELLTEKELHKVTVQEISDKAGVNRVTFYNHYLDVYDLYDKIENETLVELGLLVLRLEELPEDEFFSHLIGYISDNRSLFKMIFSPNSTGQLRSKLYKLIEGLFMQMQKEKGSKASDKHLGFMSSYRAQGCLAVVSRWVQEGFAEPPESVVGIISGLDSNTQRYISDRST